MSSEQKARKQSTPKARFVPAPSTSQDGESNLLPGLPQAVAAWIPVLSGAAPFGLAAFFRSAVEHQILHPEYASSVILRADILQDGSFDEHSAAPSSYEMQGFTTRRRIRRKIVPKQTRDAAMEQECILASRGADAQEEGLVLLLPDLNSLEDEKLPYYHPQVAALAFRYLPGKNSDDSASIRLDVVALPQEPLPSIVPPNHRIFRIALALLTSLFAVATGFVEGYEKRINHDLLTGREEVQDLYRELKERYRADLEPDVHSARITFSWMLKDWQEATDPAKHVWEDVAVAAWLIVLWKSMYTGGRPPGGFVDLGCGNGLLVYILHREGYAGYGLDLRARKSWTHYSPSPDLRTTSLDPPTLLSWSEAPFPADSFLIGNHSDELTPWVPLFAACTPGAAYLSIPCCAHELTERFTRKDYTVPAKFLSSLQASPSVTSEADDQVKALHPLLVPFYAPAPALTGRAQAYQLYLAHLSLLCGFVPEREALRMPSTKNFGLVGRKRLWDGIEDDSARQEAQQRVKDEVARMVESARGQWVARKPEGKAGEH